MKLLSKPIEVSNLPDRLPKDEQEAPPAEVITIGKDMSFYVKREGKLFKIT